VVWSTDPSWMRSPTQRRAIRRSQGFLPILKDNGKTGADAGVINRALVHYGSPSPQGHGEHRLSVLPVIRRGALKMSHRPEDPMVHRNHRLAAGDSPPVSFCGDGGQIGLLAPHPIGPGCRFLIIWCITS